MSTERAQRAAWCAVMGAHEGGRERTVGKAHVRVEHKTTYSTARIRAIRGPTETEAILL